MKWWNIPASFPGSSPAFVTYWKLGRSLGERGEEPGGNEGGAWGEQGRSLGGMRGGAWGERGRSLGEWGRSLGGTKGEAWGERGEDPGRKEGRNIFILAVNTSLLVVGHAVFCCSTHSTLLFNTQYSATQLSVLCYSAHSTLSLCYSTVSTHSSKGQPRIQPENWVCLGLVYISSLCSHARVPVAIMIWVAPINSLCSHARVPVAIMIWVVQQQSTWLAFGDCEQYPHN